MMKVIGAAQMQACDRAAIEQYRIPGALLMENAGLQVLDVLLELNGGLAPLSTAVVCGTGNNGGDGFVVARQLHNLGHEAVIFLVGGAAKLCGDALLNYEIAVAFGVAVVSLDESEAVGPDRFAAFEYVVDALFGTGIAGPVRGTARPVIEAMNASGTPIVAVDLPSGLVADSGSVGDRVAAATATVCLAALKPCHVLGPAASCCGEVTLVEISLPAQLLEAAPASFELMTRAAVAAMLPHREAEAHKGSCGRVLVVAGARGMAGAAALAARGALRSGAGLVEVACPEGVHEIVGAAVPEALVRPVAAGPEGGHAGAASDFAEPLGAADAIVVGPGMGKAAGTAKLIRELIAGAALPMVVDADGLNALGDDLAPVAAAPAPRILTPHPGEAGRLLGRDAATVQADRPSAAHELADRSGAIVVLKGHRTLVAAPGRVTVVNPTGNAGMATGGTGDVLAGVTAALMGQGTDPFRAACAGAWLHGAAGDLVADQLGERSLLAGDLADALPEAFAAVQEDE
jgi:NAD(P)H-hydrate epimerase